MGFGGRTEVLLPELRVEGRGRSPLELEREELVVKEISLAGPEPMRWTTDETRLFVSLLEAGEPGLR